jgi:hypothetical protein
MLQRYSAHAPFDQVASNEATINNVDQATTLQRYSAHAPFNQVASNGFAGSPAGLPSDLQQYVQEHKVLQEWLAQKPLGRVQAVLGISPSALAIDNSIRTAIQEKTRREQLSNMAHDIASIDDSILCQFSDGAYLLALKKAYKRGDFKVDDTSQAEADGALKNAYERGDFKVDDTSQAEAAGSLPSGN